jgi:hypothetical protein
MSMLPSKLMARRPRNTSVGCSPRTAGPPPCRRTLPRPFEPGARTGSRSRSQTGAALAARRSSISQASKRSASDWPQHAIGLRRGPRHAAAEPGRTGPTVGVRTRPAWFTFDAAHRDLCRAATYGLRPIVLRPIVCGRFLCPITDRRAALNEIIIRP